MRIMAGLLCAIFLVAPLIGIAGPATRLVVNCSPSPLPTASAHCFDATIGTPVTIYVVAAEATPVIATSYTGTVHLTSSDPTATLPPDHTFTAADAGVWAAQVTFHSLSTNKVPSPESITATDVANSLSGMQLWSVFPLEVVTQTVPALGTVSLYVMLFVLAALGLRSLQKKAS